MLEKKLCVAEFLRLRYVLERMRISAVTARLGAILETDWRSEAAEVLAQHEATGEGVVCVLMSVSTPLSA